MRYYVRSSDGVDYSVGVWVDGEYVPGTRADALRECRGLDETGAYVWGKERRSR